MSCGICGRKSDIPHACAYCGGTFCDDHALPENHNCYKMSIRNWDTRQSYEIANGNISIPPHKVRKIRAPAPEGWVNIEDYDPNPKIEDEPKPEETPKTEETSKAEDQPPKDLVKKDLSLVDSEGKWVKEPETKTEEKSEPTFLSRLLGKKNKVK